MNALPSTRLQLAIGILILVLGITVSSKAGELVFFGEDEGLGDHNGKLLAHPNSDGAQASFLSSLVGVGTEDFETIALYSAAPLPLVFGGVGTATLTGSGEIMDDRFGPSFSPGPEVDREWFGRFAISGNQYFGQVVAPGFVVVLDHPAAAFGFFATDIGDFAGKLTLSFEDGSTRTIDYPNVFTAGGTVGYFGYINTDEQFTKVSFGTTSGTDAFGVDDLTIGSREQVHVPDSGAASLLLGLAAGSLLIARRKL